MILELFSGIAGMKLEVWKEVDVDVVLSRL